MTLYKVLNKDGKSCNGGTGVWHLPTKQNGTWIPGKWMPPIEGNLAPCMNGYHLCQRGHVVLWLNASIYIAEYDGEAIKDKDKVVVRKARLLRKCESWTDRTMRHFVCDCAEHTIQQYIKQYPNDDRPQEAIRVARLYADGKATKNQLTAAYAANAAERTWQTDRLFHYLEMEEEV